MLGILQDLLSRSLTLGVVQEADLSNLLAPDGPAAAAGEPSLLGSVIRMLGALGIVLALLIFTLWLLKRMSGRVAPRVGSGAGAVEILHQRSLGGRRHLTVVRWEGRRLLLGVTSDRITALAEDIEVPASAAEPAFSSHLTEEIRAPTRMGGRL
jgi:flagellar biosynthetic protein FliO